MKAFGIVVSMVLAFASPVAAGGRITAAGVTLEPPAGWKLSSQPDGGAKLVNKEGDIVWRFFATEPAADLSAFFDAAWNAVATAHTKVDAPAAEDTPTKSGLQGRARGGVMVDAKGDAHILVLAVLTDGKNVAPMLIELATQDGLGRLDQLSVASDTIKLVAKAARPKQPFARGGWRYPISGAVAPVAAAPPPAVASTTPAAAATTAAASSLPFLGRWAVGQSATSANNAVSYGSRVLQYDFASDGTYRYHSEAWGGTFNSNWRYIVDEKGTWTASGDQLTVSPTAVTGVVRDLQGKVQKEGGPPLEKTTYRFQTTYFSGIQETQLVLTPPQPTARDGAFSTVAAFSKSYLLRSNYKPAFRFAP